MTLEPLSGFFLDALDHFLHSNVPDNNCHKVVCAIFYKHQTSGTCAGMLHVQSRTSNAEDWITNLLNKILWKSYNEIKTSTATEQEVGSWLNRINNAALHKEGTLLVYSIIINPLKKIIWKYPNPMEVTPWKHIHSKEKGRWLSIK